MSVVTSGLPIVNEPAETIWGCALHRRTAKDASWSGDGRATRRAVDSSGMEGRRPFLECPFVLPRKVEPFSAKRCACLALQV